MQGEEKIIIAVLAGVLNDPEVVIEVGEELLHLAQDNHLGSTYKREISYFDQTVDAYGPDRFMPKEEFITCVSVIIEWVRQRQAAPPAEPTLLGGMTLASAEKYLSEKSLLPAATARYILSGLGFTFFQRCRPFPAKTRAAHGYTSAEATIISWQVYEPGYLYALLATSVGDTFATTGPNLTAIVDYLRNQHADPLLHLSAAQFHDMCENYCELNTALWVLSTLTEPRSIGSPSYLAGLLYAILQLELTDSRRKVFA